MSGVVLAGLTGGGGLVVLLMSAAAVRCNVVRYRAGRRVAPLAGLDLTPARIEPYRAPRNWPVVEEVREPHVAAAYASLADDRALTTAFLGEMLMIGGGAAVGSALPLLSRPWVGAGWIVAALLVAMAGLYLRTLATRRWQPVYARYTDRYAELTAEPLPAPRRRGLLASLLGR